MSTPKTVAEPMDPIMENTCGDEPKKQRPVIDMWIESENIKQPQWLVKKFFEMDTLCGLFAPSNSGKSMLAVDLACCVASGQHWHGYKVNQGSVLYIAGEGLYGLKKRTKAWRIHHSVSGGQSPYYCTSRINGQSVVDTVEMCASVEAAGNILQHGINLVIIDTVARNFGDGDENSTHDMGKFIERMDYIRNRWHCCVLLIHHTGHDQRDRARGSSAFRAALDAEYSLTRYDRLIQFRNIKMKDADNPEPLSFELYPVELGIHDDDGQPVTSAVLDLTDKAIPEEAPKPRKMPDLNESYRKALNILHTMYGECYANLKKSNRNPDQAKVEYRDWKRRCLDAGVMTSDKNFHRIPESLENRNLIIRRAPHIFLTDTPESGA